MLKFLRKYNSYILVVGGVLLMVAFLLPETISRLGKTPLGGSAFKINGHKVSYEDASFASQEHYLLRSIVGRPEVLAAIGGGESSEHWILLCREAERQGFAGGKDDGMEFLPELIHSLVTMGYDQFIRMGMYNQIAPQIESESKKRTEALVGGMANIAGQTRMSEDEAYRALGKLHAVLRMKNAYFGAASLRLSGPRMIAGLKEISDTAKIDAVFVPPEREFAGLAEPTPDQLKAQFDRFKGTKPGEGEFGIGYLLPDRVKLAYMSIDRTAVQTGISPDAVEVRKRFLKQFPTGSPSNAEIATAAMAKIDDEVRTEQLDKVMRMIDQVVKSEFEKTMRKLEAEGEYKKLPADWATQRPDFQAISAVVEKRVKETLSATITLPPVTIKEAEWLTAKDVSELPGIGSSSLKRGNQSESFADVVFKVRELAGRNQGLLQAGVPSMEFTTDNIGNRYYFMVLDARKESAPDAYTDILAQVTTDVKRLAAFQKLKENMGGYRLLAEATADGLTAVSKSGAKTAADELPIAAALTVREGSITPKEPDLDHEDLRKAVLQAAAKLDPLTDLTTQDLAARTLVVPVAKSLGLAVVRITGVSPLTEERFRSAGGRAGSELVNRLRKQETGQREDPFSLTSMEERLNVKYPDGREKKKEAEKQG